MSKKNDRNESIKKLCEDNGIKIRIEFVEKRKYWEDDIEERNVYKVNIRNKTNSMTTLYADSILNTRNNVQPDEYDVLSSMAKEKPQSFKYWCEQNEFEYCDENKKIYNEICDEYSKISKIFKNILPAYKNIL